MKKVLSLALVGAMALSLFACGQKTGNKKPENSGQSGQQSEQKEQPSGDKNAAVFYYNFGDPYISTVRSALDKAYGEKGIKPDNQDGANNQSTQSDQIQAKLGAGTNLAVVNIVNTAAEDTALNIVDQAKQKNIPLIFFNREVTDKTVKAYDKCVFVGTDAAEAGHMQGKMIGEYLVANYDKVDLNKDGKISYVMFMGEEGNNEATYRTKYGVEDANEVLKKAGKPELEFYDAKNDKKYLVDPDGKWSAQASTDYMSTILSQYSVDKNNMVELIICNNDEMAIGAVNALNNVGFNNGDESKTIPVFGVDATESAKELIKAKKMVGTIKQDAEGMAKAIADISANLLDGKQPFEGLQLQVDKEVNKVRIPYQIYTGE